MIEGFALGLAAAPALVSLASAVIVNRRQSAQSCYLTLLTNNRREASVSLSPPQTQLAEQDFIGRGPIFRTLVIRRAELLTSNAANISANKVIQELRQTDCRSRFDKRDRSAV